MRVSAVLVINDRPSVTSSVRNLTEPGHASSSRPISCIEILGQSIVERSILRLQRVGISNITLIGGVDACSLPLKASVELVLAQNPFARWPAAQRKVVEQKAQGIETVIMIGVGAYMELNVRDVLQFHSTRGMPLTQLEDAKGPLDFWIVDAEWLTSAAPDCTLPFRYGEFPGLPVPCRTNDYVNRLADSRDLRQLVFDSFLSRCEMRPQGREVKPGIWMDEGARVHRQSRLVAPAYIGRSATIGPNTIVTGFSNVERQAELGTGTVVEASSILPHTVLGKGLDVSHAVVDGNTLVDLHREVALQIDDPRFLRNSAPRGRRIPSSQHGRESVPENGAEYIHVLARAAGRFAEVFFKG